MKAKLGNSYVARFDNATVTCRFDSVTVEIDEKEIANQLGVAAAQAVAAGIRAIGVTHPSGKRKLFNNTGHLANDIRVVDGEVLVPPDRLQNPALRERLRVLVPALAQPVAAPPVVAALEKAAAGAVRK